LERALPVGQALSPANFSLNRVEARFAADPVAWQGGLQLQNPLFSPRPHAIRRREKSPMPKPPATAPKRPVSAKQLAANRANAALSTGPVTPEGKARSCQNAVKHGFTATAFAVIRLEDPHEVARLKADLVAVYRPVNSQELFAIERMALAQQAILRAARLEAGLFTTGFNEFFDPAGGVSLLMNAEYVGDGDIEIARSQNRNFAFAEGFQRMVHRSDAWTLFLRYQAQAERNYRRALEEFERLKALRHQLPRQIPNEPISDPQPEEKEDLCPIHELNPFLPAPAPPPSSGPVLAPPPANHSPIPQSNLQPDGAERPSVRNSGQVGRS